MREKFLSVIVMGSQRDTLIYRNSYNRKDFTDMTKEMDRDIGLCPELPGGILKEGPFCPTCGLSDHKLCSPNQ